MTIALGILTFFVVLACLILIHELGHFGVAKLMGVRVEEFGLGFPPRLKSWRRGETVYSLNALPIGGFVRMLGENGDASRPDSFGAQPPWRRLLILLAGPSMNLLLAFVLFFAVWLVGLSHFLPDVTGVAPKSPAAAAGLRAGDRIVAVDGRRVQYIDQVVLIVQSHLGERISLQVRRGSGTVTTSLVPRVHPPRNQGAMGIVVSRQSVVESYSPPRAAWLAVQDLGNTVGAIPTILGGLSQHHSQVQGPIGIAQDTTQAVQNEPQTGFSLIVFLVAALSASLGVLNLLPFPALDGGRLIFVLLSLVRRRNVDPELEGMIHLVGMAVLLMLIIVISYQDLSQIVGGGAS